MTGCRLISDGWGDPGADPAEAWDRALPNELRLALAGGEPEEQVAADAVNPNHYRFPNGAEVINITEWLTSNGGQAVQYVARSTRLDGQNKGAQIEDLKKSLFFIQREIERLGG